MASGAVARGHAKVAGEGGGYDHPQTDRRTVDVVRQTKAGAADRDHELTVDQFGRRDDRVCGAAVQNDVREHFRNGERHIGEHVISHALLGRVRHHAAPYGSHVGNV